MHGRRSRDSALSVVFYCAHGTTERPPGPGLGYDTSRTRCADIYVHELEQPFLLLACFAFPSLKLEHRLDLRSNDINDGGLDALAEGMECNASVERLFVWGNNFGQVRSWRCSSARG